MSRAAALNGYITPNEEHFMSGAAHRRSCPDLEKRVASTSSPHQPSPESLAQMLAQARKDSYGGKIGLRDRIGCYQWTWFTMTMATGGVANVLHSLPYGSNGLYYVGLVFSLLNIVLFLTNCVMITIRFSTVKGSFMDSFTDQMESLFIPAAVVSCAIILINICEYGFPRNGPWLQNVIEVLFWCYVAVSVAASAGIYLILWSTQIFPIHTMTPVWVFPAYPLLLTAPFASVLIGQALASENDSVTSKPSIAICAVVVQGTGYLISFMICAAFLYRLMTQKLPHDMQRPGVFISIGPSGFTAAGLVVLGMQTDSILPNSFGGYDHAVVILKLISIMMGLWLWGLSVWFFLVSVGSLSKYFKPGRKMPFQMTWWSFVFPNTALITATEALAKVLESEGLKIFGCVMAALLVVVWVVVGIRMLRALWNRELLWPKDGSETE